MPDTVNEISKVTLPDGTTYNLKDSEARSSFPLITVAQTTGESNYTLYITSPIVNGDLEEY